MQKNFAITRCIFHQNIAGSLRVSLRGVTTNEGVTNVFFSSDARLSVCWWNGDGSALGVSQWRIFLRTYAEKRRKECFSLNLLLYMFMYLLQLLDLKLKPYLE